MTGAAAERFVVLNLRLLAATFAVVGILFIAAPDGVLSVLDDVGDAFGDFAPAPETAMRVRVRRSRPMRGPRNHNERCSRVTRRRRHTMCTKLMKTTKKTLFTFVCFVIFVNIVATPCARDTRTSQVEGNGCR